MIVDVATLDSVKFHPKHRCNGDIVLVSFDHPAVTQSEWNRDKKNKEKNISLPRRRAKTDSSQNKVSATKEFINGEDIPTTDTKLKI